MSTLATIATATVLAPSAMATSSVTIKTAFENSPISLNTSDAVGYQFTNTSGSSQDITFTDTLPAGVTFDSPVGQTLTNGTSSGCVVNSTTAASGASSVTVTITVPSPTATGTVCTLSYSVVAGTPSNDLAVSDTYSSYSASPGPLSTPTPGSLKVLSNPSLSFTAPTNNQSFYLGQVAIANFACAATDPLDSIDSFFGTDDEGNQIQSGAPIDTVDPGTHTLEVDCYSAAGGGQASQSISYTVRSYALSAVKVNKTTDVVSFKTTVPAGKLISKVFYGKKVIGTATLAATSRGTETITVKPTNAGKKLLAGLKGNAANLKLQTSFTPSPIGSGSQVITPAGATVLSKTIKLPLVHAKKAKAAKRAKTAKQARNSTSK